MKKTLTGILIGLLLINGAFFISNIYVIGDIEAALAMHDDLSPSASPFLVNIKVLNVFITGIFYIIAGIGLIIKKRIMASKGIFGTLLFISFYIIELILWGIDHPKVWLGFLLLGSLSVVLGFSSFNISKTYINKVNNNETERT